MSTLDLHPLRDAAAAAQQAVPDLLPGVSRSSCTSCSPVRTRTTTTSAATSSIRPGCSHRSTTWRACSRSARWSRCSPAARASPPSARSAGTGMLRLTPLTAAQLPAHEDPHRLPARRHRDRAAVRGRDLPRRAARHRAVGRDDRPGPGRADPVRRARDRRRPPAQRRRGRARRLGGGVSLFAFLGGTWFPITGSGLFTQFCQLLPSYWLVQAGHVGLGGRNPWGLKAWLVIAVWSVGRGGVRDVGLPSRHPPGLSETDRHDRAARRVARTRVPRCGAAAGGGTSSRRSGWSTSARRSTASPTIRTARRRSTGYLLVVAFAAAYLAALPIGWDESFGQRLFWALFAVGVALTVARVVLRRPRRAGVLRVPRACCQSPSGADCRFPLVAALTLAIGAAAALRPGLGRFVRLGHRRSTVFLVSFAMFGFFMIIQSNIELAAARAEVARLAAENERSRIARDLHDLLGHSLTTITVKAGLARRLAERDPRRARGGDRARSSSSPGARWARSARPSPDYRDVTLAGELATAHEVLRAAGIDARAARARSTPSTRRCRAVRLGGPGGGDQRRAALARDTLHDHARPALDRDRRRRARIGRRRPSGHRADRAARAPRDVRRHDHARAGTSRGWRLRADPGAAGTPTSRARVDAVSRRDDPAPARRRPGAGPLGARRAARTRGRLRGRRAGRARRRGGRRGAVRPSRRRAARHRDARAGRPRRRGRAAPASCRRAG